MSNGVVDGNAVVGVEDQRASKEVFRFGSQILEYLLEILSVFVAERLDVLNCFLIGNEVIVLLFGGAYDLEDLIELVLTRMREVVDILVWYFFLAAWWR